MRYKSVPIILASLLLFPLAFAEEKGERPQQDTTPAITEAPPGGDFTLHSADGPVSLRDFRGKLVFLFFGYTRCPDICPTSLAFLSQALHDLTARKLEKVRAIMISVDPDQDTPASLKEYVSYFHPNLIGVTGTEQEVAAVAERYGAQYYQVELEGSAFGYAVNHSAVTYLITPDGILRFIFPHGTPPGVLTQTARHVLAGN